MIKYAERFRGARKLIAEQELDLLFVVGRENLIYFTGDTQIECMALLIPREGDPAAVTLWPDVAYVKSVSGLDVHGYVFPGETLAGKAVELIRRMAPAKPRIGFERYFVQYSVYEELRRAFLESEFTGAGDLFFRLRSVKDPGEIEKMIKASAIVCRGMDAALQAVRPGRAETEVLAEAEYAMLKAGSEGSPFRPQVVSGPRTLLTHPHATGKAMKEGEAVVIHLGATYQGYCAKMCRTAALGRIPEEQDKIYSLLLEAQERAIESLRPGASAAEVDAAARGVVEGAGYGKGFLDVIGYGVGLRQSEFYPVIGRDRKDVIEAGMVVDLLLPTIYRRGSGGPRVTDIIHIGEKGPEVLTKYPREMVRV